MKQKGPERRRTMQDTLCEYLARITPVLEPSTVHNYRHALTNFIRYVEAEYPRINSFRNLRRRPHIDRWLAYLAAPGYLMKSSRRGMISRVHRFFDDISEWGWPEAPDRGLIGPDDLPVLDKYLPRALPPEDDEALLRQLERQSDFFSKGLLILRWTGLRFGEFLDLRRDDCLEEASEGQWWLHVPIGKQHEERVIPVDPETARLIEELRCLRKDAPPSIDPRSGKPVRFLFVWPNGERPRHQTFRVHLRRAAQRAGCRAKVTPHILRHTYATQLIRAGIPLPVLQKLLGHKTFGMTIRYVAVTQADVHRAFLEAYENTKHLYDFSTPTNAVLQTGPATLDSVAAALERARSLMESYRRDHLSNDVKSRAQRIVERIQRASRDFRRLYE